MNNNLNNDSNSEEEIFKKKSKERKPFFHKEKKVAQANKFETTKAKGWQKLQLPKRWVDVTDPFYFKVYNIKTDGLIFLSTTLLIPLFFIILLRMIPMLESSRTLVLGGVQLVTSLVGFFLLLTRDRNLFRSSGLIYFYLTGLVALPLTILLGLIIAFINLRDPVIIGYLSVGLSIVVDLVMAGLILSYVPNISRRMAKTFKENWKMLLLVSLIAGILMFGASFGTSLILEQIDKLIGYKLFSSTSDNQAGLNGNLSGIIPAILLFVLSVIAAPIYEELVYRHLYYTGVGNRTVAFFASAFVFALLHVESSGDIEHIFPYLAGGFFLSGVFNISRGNVTYSYLTHLIYNLIQIILMFSLFWKW